MSVKHFGIRRREIRVPWPARNLYRPARILSSFEGGYSDLKVAIEGGGEVSMQIRNAVEADLDQITAIYNEVLINSTAIYHDRPVTTDERILWWRDRVERGYPVLVAAEGDRIAGFASFGDFRTWPGYRFTVEGTIHIHAEVRGQGVGTTLLTALIEHARALGKHTMIAGVDSENVASLRFLERFGFERAGLLRQVGFKFNRFLDLIFLQYLLEQSNSKCD